MLSKLRREGALHLMLIPAVVFLFLFNYVPFFGVVIAFQKYSPAKGILHSAWIGLDNFRYVFALPNFSRVIRNTLYIACAKLALHMVIPIGFALMLNELRAKPLKRIVQTVTYLPHFLSWVILGGIIVDVLSPSSGIINMGIKAMGMEPVFFLGSSSTFPGTMIWLDVIKEMGFNAVIYLAALTAIDPTFYEAAVMDGAGRWKQTIYITLPSLTPIIVLLATLSLGNVLNAGFDEVYNLYSVPVYETGDIIDTFVYRLGLKDMQYSPSTAVGLFKSAISTLMIVLSYRIAYKATGYRII